MVSPLHAPSALSGAGPRGSASDLAVAIAKGDLLAYEVAGRTARDGVGYSKGACEGTEPVTLVGTPERRRPPRNFKTGK
jgi:hypothetical protein